MLSDEYFFDLALPSRTPTVLYSLLPMGLGDGSIESLSSYVLRLANRHKVSRRQLIYGYVKPLLDLSEADCHLFTCAGHRDRKQVVKSAGTLVSWASIFSKLTGNQDVLYCTPFWLDDVISTHQFFATTGRYCPICLEEAISNGSEPFEQQIWNVAAVTVCPKHMVRLRERRCLAPPEKRLQMHQRYQDVGSCDECGSVAYRCNTLPIEPASDEELWTSRQVFELFSYAVAGNAFYREDLTKGLLKIANEGFSGHLALLARLSSLPKSNTWRWVNDPKSRPSLQSLLQVCGAVGCTLLSLLRGDPKIGEYAPPVKPRSDVRNSISREKARELLILAISEPERFTSLKSIANKVGARSARTLRDTFPELCDELIAHNKAVELIEANRKQELIDQECRRLLIELDKQGRKPTLRNAATIVGTRWSKRSARGNTFLRLRPPFSAEDTNLGGFPVATAPAGPAS